MLLDGGIVTGPKSEVEIVEMTEFVILHDAKKSIVAMQFKSIEISLVTAAPSKKQCAMSIVKMIKHHDK